MKETPFDKISSIIKRYERFLITTHVRADGDAIGSEIALYHALKNMGKSVFIINDSPIPQSYKFVIPASGLYIHPQIPKEQPEVVFTLDCPTLERLGKVKEIIPKDAIIINIDHHISNINFGNINFVTEDMCSTGAILLSLFKDMNIKITPDIATALYVTIITDTGRFTHSNTTPDVFKAAAFLIEQGAKHLEISKYVYNTNPLNLVHLHAKVLNTLKLYHGNRIATIRITKEMLEKTNVSAIDTQELADIPISIDGVYVGVLFREMTEPNWVKISMRSRNGIDVNNVATKYGGGGHKYAAGCEIKGNIEDVQKLILNEIEKSLLKEK